MQTILGSVRQALVSGTVAAATTSLAAALAGKRETGSYVAPLNATSHIIWGDQEARQNDTSFKYTLTGVLLNYGAGIFWAAFYERWFGRGGHPDAQRSLSRPLIGAAVVTAGAYLTDYYLVPKRFTPGYELRLSGKSLLAIYGALALGLAMRDMRADIRAGT
ncbi:hypothetical protein [Noviherbaspirillum massiliense]|uniref:hypothetical protein n=1 Tax=Noviherbaspirillum massiliense TaxID=1465823 RepID=UPI0002F04685|nr:hypothetical protein [Noviherbaspirillum massiliense]